MVFQDFDQIHARRKAERKAKFRKRVAIGVIFAVILIALLATAAFMVATKHTKSDDAAGTKASPSNDKADPQQTNQVSRIKQVIQTICNGTMYKDKCRDTFKNTVKNVSALSDPQGLLISAISAADDEVAKASKKTSTFKFETPHEKGAFEDCKELMDNAREELNSSLAQLTHQKIDKLTKKAPDLNNWLSAVMSYQQTCIDGFPEGKLKSEIEDVMKTAKELTSNSLALISELFSLFSSVGGVSRHLLSRKTVLPSVDKDGFPRWMNHDQRRMLKGKKTENLTPNVTVAKDGSDKFKTISEALAAMPAKYEGRYVIYVKEGIYDEAVIVTKKMENVTIYGDGSQKSIVTGSKNFVDGVRTYQTATFAALGNGFMAIAMGFRNTAGPEKHQAVALRVQADRSVFLNCRFEGFQDTLYVQTHRQFYRSCVIAGTIDFIFGDAAAIFQNCLINIRKPSDNQQNIVTAQGRSDKFETTGIVLQNCRIEPDKDLEPVKAQFKSYLGRPWKEYSRTIVMESTIGDMIDPSGWLPWQGDFALKTLFYAEYNNKGPGSKTDARVKWPGYKVITKKQATAFTVGTFLEANWIKALAVPVRVGLSG